MKVTNWFNMISIGECSGKIKRQSIQLWVITSMLIAVHSSYAQVEVVNSTLQFQNIGIEQGFSQNSVSDILQDSRGFMWFATPNGLFQYDGYKFKTYSNEENNPNSISHNQLVDIQKGRNGSIWCLTNSVINRYNPVADNFTRFDLKHTGLTSFRSICIDRENPRRIWLGTDDNMALVLLNETSSDIIKIIYPAIVSPKIEHVGALRINSISQDSKGNIWTSFRNYLIKIVLNEGKPVVQSIGKKGYISFFVENANGDMVVSLPNGISKVLERNDELLYNTSETRIQLPDNYTNRKINQIIVKEDGRLLLVSWRTGILELNSNYEELASYPLRKNKDDFNGGDFSRVLVDKSGILWLGTYRGGLYKCDLHRKPFFTVGHRKDGKSGILTDRFINQISGDKNGNIWLGTHSGGINRLKIDEQKVKYYSNFNKEVGLSNNANCWATCYDSNGNLWLSYDGLGIKRVRINNEGEVGSVTTYDASTKPALPLGSVHFFYEDRNGIIWMANHARGGLALIEDANTNPQFIFIKDLRFEDISVSALYYDEDEYLWVATLHHGIFKMKFDEEYQVKELVNISELNDIADVPVFSFYEDAQKNMWMATFGHGLVKLLPSEQVHKYTRTSYRKKNGLPNDAVYAILNTSDDSLWISTDDGISCFRIKEETFVNYNVFDGLQNNNFRKWSALKNSDGYLLFGGTSGFTYFKPEDFSSVVKLPQVQITKLNVLQKDVPFWAYQYRNEKSANSDLQELILEPNQHSFSVEFASLQFANPEKIKYKYQLLGADKDWITVDSDQRLAAYAHLNHGHYTFRVAASSTGGVFSDDYAQIDLYLQPHWYETWWAFMLYLFTIVGLSIVGLRFQYRRQQLRSQLQLEKMERKNSIELNKAKLNFFTNISHELKTPLTIISGLVDKTLNSQDFSNAKSNLSSIGKNSNRMLQLVNQLLDFRKVEAGHLPASFVKTDFVDFTREISESFKVYAANKNYEFNFSSEFEKLDVIFDPDKIEKVISNLLANAIKYTQEGGSINIQLSDVNASYGDRISVLNKKSQLSDYLQVVVSDNGKGIAADQVNKVFEEFYQVNKNDSYTNVDKGVGIGLAYSKMLIELHNGVIFAESDEGKGASFYVIIPRIQEGNVDDEEVSDQQVQEAIGNAHNKYDDAPFVIQNSVENLNEEIIFHDHEILVVEDNNEIREFLVDYLKKHFKVIEAEDGQQGFELAMERIPDLIISDVMMPNMDGYEMCKLVKEDEKTNHIPIILLTANAQTEQRIEGLKAGADSYIPKPFHLEHLITRIQKLLELRSKLKQKYLSLSGEMTLEEIDFNAEDKSFLKNIDAIIEENLSNSELSVKDIESSLGYSRMQLYRKLKSITDLSAVEYIRNYRLKKAVEMMHSTNLRVTEIVFSVGFTSASYFGKCFRQKYGKTPTDFVKDARNL